jgi:hypothetical protein
MLIDQQPLLEKNSSTQARMLGIRIEFSANVKNSNSQQDDVQS